MAVIKYIQDHYSERVEIPMDKIYLTEKIHQKGNYQVKGIPPKKLTMIVRDMHNGNFSLVTGWRAYQECNAAHSQTGYCIIINEDRYSFIRKYGESDKKISKIKVPSSFKKSPPSAVKVRNAVENAEIGKFVPVVLSKDGYIIDGYSRLLAAKQLGMDSIPIIRDWRKTVRR